MERVQLLEKKLQHLRNWMFQVASMMEASSLQAVQNSRRLFVGGLPEDLGQVRGVCRYHHAARATSETCTQR